LYCYKADKMSFMNSAIPYANSLTEVSWFVALNEWFKTRQGIQISQLFTRILDEYSNHLHGDILLQLNTCGGSNWLSHLSYPTQWIVSPDLNDPNANCFTHISQLPFFKESIDCIVAPLTLHPYASFDYPLDEWDRVLKSDGYMIIMGLNPFSLWGLQSKIQGSACFNKQPIHLLTGFKLARLLQKKGYHSCFWSSFYGIPPVHSEAKLDQFEVLSIMERLLMSLPNGFYCYIAQKKVMSIIPPDINRTYFYERFNESPIFS
jgi:hypothetical protein